MKNDESARSVRIGLMAALLVAIVLAVIAVAVFGTRSDDNPDLLRRGLSGAGPPLAGGVETTVPDAVVKFPVPVILPSTELAADPTITHLWMRLDEMPEIYVIYETGIELILWPADEVQGTREFAKAQLADDVPGSIVDINGIEAWEVPQDDKGSLGSVRFVLGDTVVVVIGAGDFGFEDLRSVAVSIIDEARAGGD